jgi:hypothetical protein
MRTPVRRTKSSWPSRDSRSESWPSKSKYPICFRRHDQATLVAATLPVSDDKMNLPSSPSTSPRSRQLPPVANKLLFFFPQRSKHHSEGGKQAPCQSAPQLPGAPPLCAHGRADPGFPENVAGCQSSERYVEHSIIHFPLKC